MARTLFDDFKDLMNSTAKIWEYKSNNGKSVAYQEGDDFSCYVVNSTKTLYQNGVQVDSEIQVFCDASVELSDRDQLEINGTRHNILRISKHDGGKSLYGLVIFL